MRAAFCALAVCAAAVCLSGGACAGQYPFSPEPYNMYELDHSDFFSWGIDWTLPAGETITEAELRIVNINNWAYEPNRNWLYIHLMDNPAAGVTKFLDGQRQGDNWKWGGPTVGVYTDNCTDPETLTYVFSSLANVPDSNLLDDLSAFAADGRFGFGLDPDCCYFNDGISFTIYTDRDPVGGPAIPEPISLFLGTMGLGAIAGWRRLRG